MTSVGVGKSTMHKMIAEANVDMSGLVGIPEIAVKNSPAPVLPPQSSGNYSFSDILVVTCGAVMFLYVLIVG